MEDTVSSSQPAGRGEAERLIPVPRADFTLKIGEAGIMEGGFQEQAPYILHCSEKKRNEKTLSYFTPESRT